MHNCNACNHIYSVVHALLHEVLVSWQQAISKQSSLQNSKSRVCRNECITRI